MATADCVSTLMAIADIVSTIKLYSYTASLAITT